MVFQQFLVWSTIGFNGFQWLGTIGRSIEWFQGIVQVQPGFNLAEPAPRGVKGLGQNMQAGLSEGLPPPLLIFKGKKTTNSSISYLFVLVWNA